MKELQELRNYILELKNMGVIKKTTEITLLHKLNALEKQFAISDVSQQRELLNAFAFYMVKNSSPNDGMTYKDYVEQWLSI